MNWIVIIFAFFTLLTLGGAAHLGLQIQSFLKTAKKAKGVVVKQDTGSNEDNDEGSQNKNTLYAPVIRFADEKGTYHEFTSFVGDNTVRWPNGSPVEVLYDPEKPEIAAINQPLVLWTKPLILVGIGSIMLIGTLINLL